MRTTATLLMPLMLLLDACASAREIPAADIAELVRRCRAGVSSACLGAGMAEEGLGTEEALLRADDDYRLACTHGDVGACEARLLLRARRGVRDSDAEFEARRACDGNDTRVCARVLAMADDSTAGAMAEARCESGHGPSCRTAAESIARIDPGRARDWFTRGCQTGDARSCLGAAEIFEHGPAALCRPAEAEMYRARASSLFVRGCARGDAEACERASGEPLPAHAVSHVMR